MSHHDTHRLPLIDLLKVIGSQLIVLHHLAFYGPMSDYAALLMPALMDWLSDHARVVVQVFLVVGGFLGATSLAPQGHLKEPARIGSRIFERYLRLALPLLLALVVAIAAAALARQWMHHPSVPDAPTPMQLLAHLFLAQDLIGEDALSAGIWYVSIDFQLYTTLLLWMSLVAAWSKGPDTAKRVLPLGVVCAVAWSALHVNRIAAWDIAAPYFFAAHGLGALAAWARVGRTARMAFGLAMASVLLGLWLEWRERLALAASVAALLWAWQRTRSSFSVHATPRSGRVLGVVHYLSRISYAVFLLHFPVCLVVNAAFTEFVPAQPWPQAFGMLLAWTSSVAVGALFHHMAEAPAMRWITRRRSTGWHLGQRPVAD